MTPPRHPSDADLKRYLEDEELEKSIRSSVPPKAVNDAHAEVAARLETPTGIHKLEELKRELFNQAITAAKERIAAETKRADDAERAAEAALEKLEAERASVRRWWGIVLAGLIVGVGTAGIIGVFVVIVRAWASGK